MLEPKTKTNNSNCTFLKSSNMFITNWPLFDSFYAAKVSMLFELWVLSTRFCTLFFVFFPFDCFASFDLLVPVLSNQYFLFIFLLLLLRFVFFPSSYYIFFNYCTHMLFLLVSCTTNTVTWFFFLIFSFETLGAFCFF